MRSKLKGLRREYILNYAITSFVATPFVANSWKIAKEDKESLGDIFGWAVPNISLPDIIYITIITLCLFLSIILGICAFVPQIQNMGTKIIKLFSIPLGVISLISFGVSWLDGLSLMKDIANVPVILVNLLLYTGLIWFLVLGIYTIIYPWIKKKPYKFLSKLR